MKKLALALVACLAVLALLFVLGPGVPIDTMLHPPDLPDDLDGYLARSEARFSDVREGAEKTILWADASKRKTALSIVYLHGFSATRQETRPLCDTLAARLGANLFYTRLTGHGRADDAMAEATVNAWLDDGAEALAVGRRLGERVLLVGTSTGATLAVWLAAQPENRDLAALALISPNFYPKDANVRFLLWPWGKVLARLALGPYRSWTPHNEAQGRHWTTRYPSAALLPMMGLVDLVERTDLGAVHTPVLVVYSPQDQVVSAKRTEARFPEFGAENKRLVPVEEAGDPSNHVLAGQILSPENTAPVAEVILDFVQPLLHEDR